MNEITLSSDIKQIELEINYHKNIAGQSIWEIGRRLNYVKENDLAHGEFIKWVESNLKMDAREAQRFMKVASELPNTTTWSHLGGRALYLISTLPEEERTKEHETDKGETKTPDEMTVKELQNLKRRLRVADQNNASKQSDIDRLIRLNKELKNQPPKVIEKTIEIIPKDYEQMKQTNEAMQDQLNRLSGDLKLSKAKYELLQSTTAEAKELERKINSLKTQEKTLVEQMKAVDDFHLLEKEFNEFFDAKLAPVRFKGVSNHLYATNAIERIRSMISQVELWAEEMRKILPNPNIKIIEGVYEDDE